MAVQSTGIVWAPTITNASTSQAWSDPTNANGAPNQVWAIREDVSGSFADSIVSDCIRATGFGTTFDSLLPANCIIRGVKAHVVRRASHSFATDSVVRLTSSTTSFHPLSEDKSSASLWTTAASPGETVEYGAADDDWGLNLLRAVVVGTGFGIALGQQGNTGGSAYDLYIDAIGIELFYEEVKTTGALFPATAASTGWANPNNAKADDTSYATRTYAGSEDPGVATGGVYLSGYGAAIPAGSTILGCGAVMGRFATTAGPRDRFVQLHLNGTLIGANKWVSGSNWGTSSTGTAAYGNADSDSWSVSGGLTPDLINDPTFGIVVEARNNNASARQANLDYVSLEFHYIPSEPLDLEGALAAEGSATVALLRARPLAGTLTATGTASVDLRVARPLAGALAGIGTASVAIHAQRPLAGTLAAEGIATANLGVIPTGLSGNLIATGTATATLTARRPLAGALTGAGVASAALTRARPLSGALAGVGTASVILIAIRPLSGDLVGEGVAAVDLQLVTPIVPAITPPGRIIRFPTSRKSGRTIRFQPSLREGRTLRIQ